MVKQNVKGGVGERDVINRFYKITGVRLERDRNQARKGGYDLEGLPALAIEVKNHKAISELSSWWNQTVKQAIDASRIPVLIYKVHQKGWVVRLPLSVVLGHPNTRVVGTGDPKDYSDMTYTTDMKMEAFAAVCKTHGWL